jgi:formylglycine-generating enzyme required for sulfatase activity
MFQKISTRLQAVVPEFARRGAGTSAGLKTGNNDAHAQDSGRLASAIRGAVASVLPGVAPPVYGADGSRQVPYAPLENLPPHILEQIVGYSDVVGPGSLPSISRVSTTFRIASLDAALSVVRLAVEHRLAGRSGGLPNERDAHRFLEQFLPPLSAGDARAPLSIKAAMGLVARGARQYFHGDGARSPEVSAYDVRVAYGIIKSYLSFVPIKAGEFMMGSPVTEARRFANEVQHSVRLTRPFLMQKTPVTQQEWQELMGNNPSSFSRDTKAGGRASERPVERVSWFDAVAFANAKSRREGLTPCYDLSRCTGTPGVDYAGPDDITCDMSANGYRLPTEAEWEYAARAGTEGPTYADAAQGERLGDIAWTWENANKTTHPVGQKAANAWGLHDMIGHVFEWNGDKFGELTDAQVNDPQGPNAGRLRVFRGGCWSSDTGSARAAYRYYDWPSGGCDGLGFRLARSVPLTSEPLPTAAQRGPRQAIADYGRLSEVAVQRMV